MGSSDVTVGEAGGGVGEGVAPAGTRQQMYHAVNTCRGEGRGANGEQDYTMIVISHYCLL